MTGNAPHRTLEEWLRDAYGPEAGCPPPEAYLEAESGALDAAARRRLDEHADRCPACAAERDLARLFDADPAAGDVRPEDLAYVVARLEETSPVRRPEAKVVAFPVRSRQRLWRGLAAAAVVVLAAGLFLQRFYAAPPLPAPPPSGGVVRGGEVEPVAPVGEVAEVPAELRWAPRPGAVSYRVRLTAVDDAVLWEGTVAAPPARLPADVVRGLQRAVVYVWTVEALGPDGRRLAASEPVRFRARPAPEE
jgi:hypothetical protein